MTQCPLFTGRARKKERQREKKIEREKERERERERKREGVSERERERVCVCVRRRGKGRRRGWGTWRLRALSKKSSTILPFSGSAHHVVRLQAPMAPSHRLACFLKKMHKWKNETPSPEVE